MGKDKLICLVALLPFVVLLSSLSLLVYLAGQTPDAAKGCVFGAFLIGVAAGVYSATVLRIFLRM